MVRRSVVQGMTIFKKRHYEEVDEEENDEENEYIKNSAVPSAPLK